MKRRPRVDDEGDGLDSLLDTMMNVVGILVLVLIATQLGVQDAVTRITDAEVIDAEDLAEARESLSLSKDQRDAIQSQLDDLKPVDEATLNVQLSDLRRRLDQSRAQLDQENRTSNQYALRIEQDTKKATAAKKQISDLAEAKGLRESLQKKLNAALKDEARLKALLDDTPIRQPPPSKVVTLPDPRPAPKGARPVTLLCVNNKVYPIAADDWRDKMRKKAEHVVKSKRLDGGPDKGVEFERFQRDFKRVNRTVRDDFFFIEIYASGIHPRLKFIPNEKSGATVQEVEKRNSRFQRMLKVLDKQKYYARFIVLPDSYEVYLSARETASKMGLLAGWSPQAESWQFTTHLGGSILFGPKPKPNPNPPPRPAKPAKPAKPRKPQNVID